MLCGDLNVARTDTDVHPKERKPRAIGQLPEERALLERIIGRGLVDVGRALDPDNDGLFTWWAPWRNMRQRNIGWRLDYVLASEALAAARRVVPGAEGGRHERPRAGDGDLRLTRSMHVTKREATKLADLVARLLRESSRSSRLRRSCRPRIMSIVVQKYGGSSVADVDAHPAGRRARHAHAARRATTSSSSSPRWATRPTSCSRSPSRCRRIPDRRELDMLLTAGERISMALLSMAIRELGGDAISFTGSQSGIITNDRHVDARIIEVRPFRVQDELARGRIVVIAGYQGVSYRREVTTLGRGGSDTTAVAMAAALGAEYCEICSDVDGVYTADPRVVPTATRIGTLSYEETQELAESGAKVLNAQAVEFAKETGHRDLRARARRRALPGADPSADGTVVRQHRRRDCRARSSASASERDVCCVRRTRPQECRCPARGCSTSTASPASSCTQSDGDADAGRLARESAR